jgi:hypothetical protein
LETRYRRGQYLRPNIAEFADISEIFWQTNFRYVSSTKGVPNIAEFANITQIFGQKTFGDIGPPV